MGGQYPKYDKNPLRAAMIVFLIMQESANVQDNTWYADLHGTLCKILRSTHKVIHYIRNGRTCIASMGRFPNEFELLTKAQTERIAEEIETAVHMKKLRAQHVA